MTSPHDPTDHKSPNAARTDPSGREQIDRTFRTYEESGRTQRLWSGPGATYLLEERWRLTASLLRRAGFETQSALALNVGCGDGHEVPRFVALGFRPSALVCVDILPWRMTKGKSSHPRVRFIAADTALLPFEDEQFDLVHQSVMVSSVLDAGARTRIAEEMFRVTRPGGMIVWYDMRYPNLGNPNTKPISRRELVRLFPGCKGMIRSVSLLPPLARRVAPISIGLCRLLERVPFLRSHILAVLKRP